jgi:hypothetical protein
MVRQARAILVIALVWAAAWLPLGLGLGLYAGGRPSSPADIIFRPVSLPLFVSAWTGWGAISGAGFAILLGWAERRRRLDQLSPARTALWGAMGAATVPGILTVRDFVLGSGLPPGSWRFPMLALTVSALLGAGCAALTLALARPPAASRGSTR